MKGKASKDTPVRDITTTHIVSDPRDLTLVYAAGQGDGKVGIVRGIRAAPGGNVTMDREALTLEVPAIAFAVTRS